jgi:hypothetical protein
MDLRIDKEAVERAISDAIVQSAIGDKVKKAVSDLLDKGYNNPLDQESPDV